MKLMMVMVIMMLMVWESWASSRLVQTYGNSIVQLSQDKIEEKVEVVEAPKQQPIVININTPEPKEKFGKLEAEVNRPLPSTTEDGYVRRGAYYFKDSSK